MKKFCSVFLSVVLLAVLLCPVFTADAQGEKSTKAIYVVFDNSGSMYLGENKAWSQATYAMEAFASMLNFENGDTMRVYTMHNVTTDGSSNPSTENIINVSNKADIQKIHNMYTENALGTPYSQVSAALADLQASGAYEKWLVVLTDGAFDSDVPAGGVENHLAAAGTSAENLHVQYLAVGAEATALSGNPSAGFYADKAATSSDVIDALANISNRIFKRNAIQNFQSGGTLSFDIPISKVIVFAQGESVQIGALQGKDGNSVSAADSNAISYSTTAGTGRCPCVADTSLKGEIVTFGNVAAGEYTLQVDGAQQMAVYYEPDIAFAAELVRGDQKYTGGEIEDGTYALKVGFKDKTTGEFIAGSSLLGTAKYDLYVNGENYSVESPNGAPIEQEVTLPLGELSVKANVRYLADYMDSVSLTGTVVQHKIHLNMNFENADQPFTLKTLETDSKPILVRVTKDNGEPLTESEWQNTDISNVESEKDVAWAWERGTEVSTYLISPHYYKEDMYKTGSGDVDFKVTMTSSEESFAEASEGVGSLHIENDKTILDVLKHYWWQITLCGGLLAILLGYVPGIKKYLPKSLKVRPLVKGTPKVAGRKMEEGHGRYQKNLSSTLIPYIPETGSIKFLPGGVSGFPNLRVKATKNKGMLLQNTRAFAGKKGIAIDGMVIPPDPKKPMRLSASAQIKATVDGMEYKCILNQ